MCDYGAGKEVISLLKRFLYDTPSIEKERVLDELCYTSFGPIVKYFRRELDASHIENFEESLRKYIFPFHLKIAYPDNTWCRNCNSMSHITDCVRKVLFNSNVVLAEDYCFDCPPASPKNNTTHVANFGYYGVSQHYQVFNLSLLKNVSSVCWYSARAEIDDSYDGWLLAQYCYPFTHELALCSSEVKDHYYPKDEEVYSEFGYFAPDETTGR